MTDALTTIACMCLTTLLMALIVSLSHRRLTATITGAWRGATAQVTIAGNGTAPPATRGAGGWGPLVWMPAWCQTGGLLPDGGLDPQQYNDCGETCCAMVIAATRGVALHPGDIRQQLGGPARSGLTTASDLVAALKLSSVSAQALTLDADHAWGELVGCYGLARPAIVLGNWLSLSSLHWMLLVDKAPGALVFRDPWTGQRKGVTVWAFKAAYAGSVVVVDDRCLFDAHAWPTPGTGSQA